MKLILITLFAAIIFLGCSEKKVPDKEQEKMLFDEVIKVHNEVMGSDEQLMNNKMLLDSMVKYNSTGDVKDSVYKYIGDLNLADSAMDNWMHKFDPDYKGKGHDDIMAYLNSQKKQVVAIDSQLNRAVKASGRYLVKMKMK